jgi:hypothetical protein
VGAAHARHRTAGSTLTEIATLGKLRGVSSSTDGVAPADRGAEVWTTRALFARHKLIGLCAVALLALLIAIILAGIMGSSTVVVSDASTCATWSSANQTQQLAYGQRYVREHGALPSGAGNPTSVVAAVNTGCTQAFDNDAEQDVTVVQAIKG